MKSESRLPFVFIGSSSEGKDIAEAIQQNLDATCEVQIWTQDVFELGSGTLDSLVKRIDMYDFAVLVLTPDDEITSRSVKSWAPRDNVVFELGLFMGRLTPYRTYIVHERERPPKLPSDLAGISTAPFRKPAVGSLRSALGTATTTIATSIKKHGLKKRAPDGSGMIRITVDIYYRTKGFNSDIATELAEILAGSGVTTRIMQHLITSQPDAIFIGSLISAEEARQVLTHVTHPIKFIFPTTYPESEGGAADGRKIGVGYSSKYNNGIIDHRTRPARISRLELSRLLDPSLSSADFHFYLNRLFLPDRK